MKTDVENRYIWYKGNIVNVNDAQINILAPTAQFGLNVFLVIGIVKKINFMPLDLMITIIDCFVQQD